MDTLDTLSQDVEPERSVLLSDAIILFDDDGPPGESCQAGLPSTCPETYNLTYSIRPERADGETRTETFERQTEADLSWDGAHLLCEGEDRLMRTEPFRFFSMQVPWGTVVHEGSNGITFSPPINGVNERGDGGLTGAHCSATVESDSFARTGTLETPGFGIRSVRLEGLFDRVEYDEETRIVALYCRYQLDGKQLTTWRNRPNDVIAANGSGFVRGYDLSGSALQDACSSLASRVCVGGRNSAGIQMCLENETQGCVNDFSQSLDPCDACGMRQSCSSHSECFGGSGQCEDGCCTYTPR